MKIRTDFVTNSSSSSFTTLYINNEILDNYFKENGIDKKVFEDIWEEINGSDGSGDTFEPINISYSAADTFYNLLTCARIHGWYRLDKNNYQKLKKFVRANRKSIDSANGEIFISSFYSVTDDVGTFYISVDIRNGLCELLKCFEEEGAPSNRYQAEDNPEDFRWFEDRDIYYIDGVCDPHKWAERFGNKKEYSCDEIEILLRTDTERKMRNGLPLEIKKYINNLNQDELFYLKKQLEKKYPGDSIKIDNKSLQTEIYNFVIDESKYHESLARNNGYGCLELLTEEIKRFRSIKEFENFNINKSDIVFTSKNFTFDLEDKYLEYKSMIEAAGGHYKKNISGQTDYFVIDDNWKNYALHSDIKCKKLLEYINNGVQITVVTVSHLKNQFSKLNIDIKKTDNKIKEENPKAQITFNNSSLSINSVDCLHCNEKYFCTTFLDDYKEEIDRIFNKYGAKRKESMSKKINILVIHDENTRSSKTDKASELINNGQDIVVITYDYLKKLNENGKIVE